MRQQTRSTTNKGFSLVEVVIAIGIVAILLTTFMAVFGPAQQNIVRALGVADVSRLTSTLENEMGYLREGEEGTYDSAFEKAFEWIKDSGSESSAIVVYQYQADPTAENKDKTLTAINTSTSGAPGVDYITQTVARKVDSSYISSELAPGVVVGSVYAVRMTQLKEATDGSLELGSAGSIVNPPPVSKTATNADEYTGGYLAFQAEFFLLPNNLSGFVTGGQWKFEKLGDPIVVQNIAVRK